MRRHVPLVILSLAFLSLIQTSVWSQATNPAQFFEESFGALNRKAAATRAFDDDLELAQQIFDATETLKTDAAVPVAVYLLDRVFSLAIADAAGYDLALDAMEHRIKIMPAEAETTRQRTEQALRRAYVRERGEAKTAAGIRLADYLTMLGDLRAASSDFGGAARLYVQAQRFAKDVESPSLPDIEAKAIAAADREKLEQRIEQAQERFIEGVSRAAAADELVNIYLLEFNEAGEAAKYASGGTDESAKQFVPLLLRDPEDVGATALKLGQWCETLATRAPAKTKLAWYLQSRIYSELFFTDATSSELDRLKASITLKRVKAEIAKLDPEYTKTVAPVDYHGEVDLLKDIALDRYKVAGLWSKGEVAPANPEAANADAADAKPDNPNAVVANPVIAHALADRAQLMLPARPQDTYELSVEFERTAGDGEVAIQFPVGDRSVRLVLGGWQGKAAGLYPMATDQPSQVAGGPVKNKTTVTPHALSNDKRYRVKVRVDRTKTTHAVAVEFEGNTLIRWSGMASEFSDDPDHALDHPQAIGLIAKQADVVFKVAKLKPIRGDAIILPKPSTLFERGVITKRDGTVDLLELWDNKKDVIDGTWSVADGVLTAVPGRQNIGRTLLPVMPVSDYSLHVEFTRVADQNADAPLIYLPWGDNAVAFVCIYNRKRETGHAGLAAIDGKAVDEGPASVPHKGFVVGKKYVLDARLKKDGDDVAIEIDLDGEAYLRWKGKPELLAVPATIPLKDNRTLGLGCQFGNITLEKIHFKSTAGDAPLTRQAAAPAVAVAAVTDTKAVFPLKHIDMQRDRAGGTWQLAGDRLVTEVRGLNAMSLLSLPVRPKGDYKLKLQFAPTAGRPVLHVYLPVAGSAMQMDVGRVHGKFSSLRAVGNATPLDSSAAVRVTNGRTYTFDVAVEHVGGKVNVKVSADGKPFLAWSGTPADLASANTGNLPEKFNMRAISVGVLNDVARSGGVVSNVRLQMTKGTPNTLK